MIKKYFFALLCLLPFKLPNFFLRLFGVNITNKAKIGFSIILLSDINMIGNSKIGHFNFIKCDKLYLEDQSYIGHLNKIKGPFDIELGKRSAIGNSNKLVRANLGVTYGKSVLKLGELSKVTSEHYLDLTNSITMGNFTTLAGIRSQIWTHGYMHANIGEDRVRIDGKIEIGNNVYIGSGCIFNPGVKILNAISVGSGSILSKNLKKPGMYVNQPLRYLDNDIEVVKRKLKRLDNPDVIDKVYLKE